MNRTTFTILGLITLGLLSWGLHEALVVAPTEQTMGNIQRIFYYHFPSAMTAFILFFVNFIASIVYLLRRNAPGGAKGADGIAVSAAEVGLVYCTIVLVTGPLWAKPVWGIWWTWDARLTLTLVLWLMYVSYLILRRYSSGEQTATIAAALAIFAFLDVPINYMAIRWWRTQHPSPVMAGGEGSGLDPAMWKAVWINWLAFSVFAFLVTWIRYRLERVHQQLEEREAMRAIDSKPQTRMSPQETR
jgi:heme exporter protein C